MLPIFVVRGFMSWLDSLSYIIAVCTDIGVCRVCEELIYSL